MFRLSAQQATLFIGGAKAAGSGGLGREREARKERKEKIMPVDRPLLVLFPI